MFGSRRILLSAVLLLLMMGLLAGGGARRESVTFDEVAHAAAGVSYLQKLDLRMNEEHPPLAKVVAALPLVLRGAPADYSHISWTFSEKTFRQYLGEWVFGYWFLIHWNEPDSTLFWARMPMLAMTLLLGWVVYVFGCKLSNSWGGLLCLVAYVSMPAFLAFGPLVITDIVIALFWVLAVWQLAAMWRSPSRADVILFGLAFAGALLSKFSSGLLFFVFPAVALSMRLRPLPEQPTDKTERRRWRRQAWRNILKGTLWAALFVYAVYFILSWNQPTDFFSLIPHFPASPFLRRLLMPVGIYVRGLLGFALSAGSRPTFILGHAYPHGVWFYFPVLFLLKSQLAFLLLLLLTLAAGIAAKLRPLPEFSAIAAGRELQWRCLWVSLIIYGGACLLSRLDLSIRHFSVPLTLIVLLLAPLPRLLDSLTRTSSVLARGGKWASVALAAIALVTAIRVYPNYFPFISSLGLGRPGYVLMNDSNIDWNQSLPEVEGFASSRGLQQILIDEYGVIEPYVYVPQAQLWNCQQPSAADAGKWAVVSANNILYSRNCPWLMQYPHQELAGGSMYAFHLGNTIPAAGQQGGPPLPNDYRNFAGMPGFDVRDIFFKLIRDPQQLQPTMEQFMAMAQAQAQAQKKAKK